MQAHWEHRLLHLAGNFPHAAVTRSRSSSQVGDASLQAAYAACETITAQHSKTFYLASALLPAEKRPAIRALYAFCRTVDDLVDLPAEADRDQKLNDWRRIVQSGTAPRSDLVAAAWADTLTRYHIPRIYALQLIDGVARDLAQTRYESFDDLATYCYGVASTVGLMSMHIIGFRSSQAVPYAIRLGVALQLTNILRDVGEDLANGRIYLPREELDAYGLCEADLSAGHVTERWREFMRFQLERTRRLYADSWPGIKMLAPGGQMAIGAASLFYSRILDDIEAHGYDVFRRRAHLTRWEKVSLIPLLWLKVMTL